MQNNFANWLCSFATIFIFFIGIPFAKADWINMTGAETSPNIAEIYVLDDHVKLVLEVYVGDLRTFEDLIPDDWLRDSANKRPSTAMRLRRFSEQTFRFIDDRGKKLQAKLKLIEPRLRKDRQSPFAGMINPITRQRVPEAPADKRVIYAELIYPFKQKPKTLTILPPLDDQGRGRVSIGFIAYHKAVPIIDFRYLSTSAHLNLDWDDPWYSKFDNPNLKRHHKSALMSFLYVEPYEVRHEILTRVKDLEQWIDLGLRGKEYIDIDELEPLKRHIAEFLVTKNPVRVDGKLLKPILDRANYVKVSLTGIQLIEQPERLEISTAIVGVIIAYMTNGLPREVTIDWELFTDQIQKVPISAIDPAGPLASYISPDDNLITWTNFLKNYKLPQIAEVTVDDSLLRFSLPVGTIVCLLVLLLVLWRLRIHIRNKQSVRLLTVLAVVLLVGAILLYPAPRVSLAKPAAISPMLADSDAVLILHNLLKNIYRAFDFREEEDVYDKLAISVTGDLLAEVYLQNRKSFAVKKAGGAQAKVKQVEVLEMSTDKVVDGSLSFIFKAKWSAMGTVGHWGHVHMRKNLYDAIVTVQAVNGMWMITGLELLEEKRVNSYAQANTPSS